MHEQHIRFRPSQIPKWTQIQTNFWFSVGKDTTQMRCYRMILLFFRWTSMVYGHFCFWSRPGIDHVATFLLFQRNCVAFHVQKPI